MVLNGVKNFLQLICDNWTLIITIIGLLMLLYRKITNYLKLSDEKKIEVAWKNIRQSILSWVSEAEDYWTEQKQLEGAGQIKRSEVLAKVYAQYPILNKIVDQYSVIRKLDALIDEALGMMKNILEKNESGDDVDETTQSISNKE